MSFILFPFFSLFLVLALIFPFLTIFLYFLTHFEVYTSCREYLATFKKTVAVHEMFLQRLVSHPVFKNDHNLHVFLEYEQDVSNTFCLSPFLKHYKKLSVDSESY